MAQGAGHVNGAVYSRPAETSGTINEIRVAQENYVVGITSGQDSCKEVVCRITLSAAE